MTEYGVNTDEVLASLENIQNQYDNIISSFTSSWQNFDAEMAQTWYSNTAKQNMQSFAATLTGMFNGEVANINEYFTELVNLIVRSHNEIAVNLNNGSTISYSISTVNPIFETSVQEKRSDGFEGVIPENEESAALAFLRLNDETTSAMSSIGNMTTGFTTDVDSRLQENINRNIATLQGIIQNMSSIMRSEFTSITDATKNVLNSIDFS